jgi:N-acetylglutamate synthase-like GNAT family acetyltransferase
MTSSTFQVRRATLDDIDQLTALWKSMHFAADDLARRVTEFQVAESDDGKLLGAVGLSVISGQALIHSEGFTDFSWADHLRPHLWERLHAVAVNRGLLRLWTQEEAPFWHHSGLDKADGETLKKLPPEWATAKASRAWLTLKLKDDLEAAVSLDQQFQLFMASEKARTERSLQQARLLKLLATLLAGAVLVLVFVGGFYVIRHMPGLLRR